MWYNHKLRRPRSRLPNPQAFWVEWTILPLEPLWKTLDRLRPNASHLLWELDVEHAVVTQRPTNRVRLEFNVRLPQSAPDNPRLERCIRQFDRFCETGDLCIVLDYPYAP